MLQGKRIRMRFFMLLFMLAAIGLLSWVVQYLWNWLIAPTFSVSTFSYLQALGLFILCRILFGGFKFGPSGRSNRPHYKNREKWMNMSEEERRQFKSEWEKKCDKRN